METSFTARGMQEALEAGGARGSQLTVDRFRQVVTRIGEGFYERHQVQEQTAHQLAKDLGGLRLRS